MHILFLFLDLLFYSTFFSNIFIWCHLVGKGVQILSSGLLGSYHIFQFAHICIVQSQIKGIV